MPSRYPRLSLLDRSALRIERADTPAHIAGLCLLTAEPLLDATGALDLEMIKRRLERRLVRALALRRILQPTPPLGGPPLWVDDPQFSIDRHILTARLAPPGDEAILFRTVELVLRQLLDRSHPLWELWFLTGLHDGRVGMLFKIHHALADGGAAIALIVSLLDLASDAPDAPEPPASSWPLTPAPSPQALVCDNVGSRLAAIRSTLAHPVHVARGVGARSSSCTLAKAAFRMLKYSSKCATPVARAGASETTTIITASARETRVVWPLGAERPIRLAQPEPALERVAGAKISR